MKETDMPQTEMNGVVREVITEVKLGEGNNATVFNEVAISRKNCPI